jgi:hypothetical protein
MPGLKAQIFRRRIGQAHDVQTSVALAHGAVQRLSAIEESAVFHFSP